MQKSLGLLVPIFNGAFAVAVLTAPASAQAPFDRIPPSLRPPQREIKARPPADPKARATQISIEISAGNDGVGLPALRWSKVFDELGIPISITPGNPDQKPETTELQVGAQRRVTARGQMDKTGRLLFAGGRVFSPNEPEKLRQWVDDLKSYGAQGSPAGQPIWGLSPDQFSALYTALGTPVTEEVSGLRLAEAITKLGIDPRYPIDSPELRRVVNDTGAAGIKVQNALLGISKGTALAVMLAERGLAFRPVRAPSGQITLEIVGRGATDDNNAWPIGWEPKNGRPQAAPALFKLLPIELNDVPFLDVASAVAAQADVAVLYDSERIKARGVDVSALKVTFRPRQATYFGLLQEMTLINHLNHTLKVDELGHPVVWISAMVRPQPAPKLR